MCVEELELVESSIVQISKRMKVFVGRRYTTSAYRGVRRAMDT